MKPYERNSKIHTEKQIENICTSIRKAGWQQDTVITSDKVLVIGHFDTVHPLGTLEEVGMQEHDGRMYGPGIYDKPRLSPERQCLSSI